MHSRPFLRQLMELCLNRATLPLDTPAAQVITAAQAAGFTRIEMSARRLREAVEDGPCARDLITGGHILPVHGGWSIRLHWEKERFERALTAVDAEMEYVSRLGSRSGALVLPRKAAHSSVTLPSRQELTDRIRRVAERAAAHGLDVVVEFNGLHADDPAECGLRTFGETLAVIDDAGPNVGVLIDSFHWHASGGSLADLAEIPPAMPIFVHLNDAPQVDRAVLEDSMRVLPGEGCIDLQGLISTLRGRRYAGALSIELKSPALHAVGPGEAARLAYQSGVRLLAGRPDQPDAGITGRHGSRS